MTKPKKDAHLYRRGNTTSGPDRKGYKGGRRGDYPTGTPMYPVLIQLDSRHNAIAIYVGGGTAGRGIRALLEAAAATLDPTWPLERNAAYGIMQTNPAAQAELKARAKRALAGPAAPTVALTATDWDDMPPFLSGEFQ